MFKSNSISNHRGIWGRVKWFGFSLIGSIFIVILFACFSKFILSWDLLKDFFGDRGFLHITLAISTLPVSLAVWYFRTLDKKQDNFFQASALFGSKDNKRLGLIQLMYLKNKEKVFIEEINNITKRALLSGEDLMSLDLSYINLTRARLNKANLKESVLYRSDLSMAELQGADLSRALLFETTLELADLTGANLFRVKIENSNLEKTMFRKANLEEAYLIYTSLNNTDLEKANLKKATLIGSNLEKALYLEEAELLDACYDKDTKFPLNFDPKKYGMREITLQQSEMIRIKWKIK